MSEYNMGKLSENVDCCSVYDLDESICASKYPFAINPYECSPEETATVDKLAKSPKGNGEDNFLCGIRVAFDLTFSNKAWVEAERYHFFDIVSSQSTMHCISKFDPEIMCNPYVDKRIVYVLKELISTYNNDKTEGNFLRLIYNIPSGFQLTARVTTNYRQLKTIYSQRKNHRLKPDWGELCYAIRRLPNSSWITGE